MSMGMTGGKSCLSTKVGQGSRQTLHTKRSLDGRSSHLTSIVSINNSYELKPSSPLEPETAANE